MFYSVARALPPSDRAEELFEVRDRLPSQAAETSRQHGQGAGHPRPANGDVRHCQQQETIAAQRHGQ